MWHTEGVKDDAIHYKAWVFISISLALPIESHTMKPHRASGHFSSAAFRCFAILKPPEGFTSEWDSLYGSCGRWVYLMLLLWYWDERDSSISCHQLRNVAECRISVMPLLHPGENAFSISLPHAVASEQPRALLNTCFNDAAFFYCR